MVEAAVHYLRTEEHYRNAPVGTALAGKLSGRPGVTKSAYWRKAGPDRWVSWRSARVVGSRQLAGSRRRILQWGSA